MFNLLLREMQALWRHPLQILNPIAFLFLGVMLFAIALPGESQHVYGGGVLWVLVLLTTILSLDTLFRRDYDSGVLEQMLISAPSPFALILLKLLAQWAVSGLVMTLLAPILGLLLSVPPEGIGVLTLSLLIGTPALTLLGGVGAGLTVGLNRGGIVLALLVLPLFLPALIFGVGAVQEVLIGARATSQLSWLGVISMVALTVGPFATLAGLRISIQLQ